MKNDKITKLKNVWNKADGWKKKLSIFLALSLVLSGVKGISLLGIGGVNDAPEGNAVEIRGDRVKLHLEGETVRELAEIAIREGDLVCVENGELSYSRNEELLARYRELFSEEREIYELPLNRAVEGLDELSAIGGKIRAFVEVDSNQQRGNTEKDSMDAVALFSRDSSFGRLLLSVKGESYFASVKERDQSGVRGEEKAPGGEFGPGQEVKEKKESAGITGPGQGLQAEIETEQTEVVRPGQWIYPENTESGEENAPKQELQPRGETDNQAQESEENLPHGEGIEGPGSEVGSSKENTESREIGPGSEISSAETTAEAQEASADTSETEALSGEGASSEQALAEDASTESSSIEEGASGEVETAENRTEIQETAVETETAQETIGESEESTAESVTETETEEVKEKPDRTEYQLNGTELIYFLYENESDDDLSFHLFVSENSYPKIRVPGRNKLGRQLLQDAKPGKAENATDSNREEEKEEDEESRVSGSSLSLDEEGIRALYKEMKDGPDEYYSELRAVKLQEYSLNELGRISQNIEVEGFGTVEVFYDKDDFTEKVNLKASLLKKPEEVKEEAQESEVSAEETVTEEAAKEEAAIKEAATEVESAAEETVAEETVAKETEAKKTIVEEASTEEGATVEEALSEDGSDTGTAKGEKARTSDVLEENEVEALKENGIYDQSISLDIHFENKDGIEVEPSSSVSMRFYIARSALPEEVNEENIAIHHLVEKENGEIDHVEKLSAVKGEEKKADKKELTEETDTERNEGKELRETAGQERETKENGKEEIIREFMVEKFSVFTITWGNEFLTWFYYMDGDFRSIGPDRYLDFSTMPTNYVLYAAPDLFVQANLDAYNVLTGYPEMPGYKRHTMVYPSSMAYGAAGWDREQVVYTDPAMFISTLRATSAAHLARWDEASVRKRTKWRSLGCLCYRYYYFFYLLDPAARTHTYDETPATVRQEKYITKKNAGEYELSLTAEAIAENEKTPLDVIFLYDRSAFMAYPYDYAMPTTTGRPENSKYMPNDPDSRHTKGKEFVSQLVDLLKNNPTYDTHFALATMGGSRTSTTYKKSGGSYVVKSEDGLQRLEVTDVQDTDWNDGGMFYGFTDDATVFKNKLQDIQLEQEGAGLNYGAGLLGVKDFQDGQTAGTDTLPVRADSKRVVIMLSSFDPTYSYILHDDIYKPLDAQGRAQYEMWAYLGGGTSGLPYGHYKSFYPLKEGWSYGGGRGYQDHALTYARGLLAQLGDIDAFYSVGLGPKANWPHLKDLTGKSEKHFISGHPMEKPLADSVDQEVIDLSDKTKIPDVVKELRAKVQTHRINSFKIWDQLSENVEPNFNPDDPVERAANLRCEVWKTDDDGKPIAGGRITNWLSLPEFNGIQTVDLKYDKLSHVVSLDVTAENAFSMPKNYQFRVVINVKPTQKAYEKYQKNILDYYDKEDERWTIAGTKDIGYLDNVNGENISGTRTPDLTSSLKEGDPKTDQWKLYGKVPEEEFHTSSEKEGFYSNEGAYLKYVRFKGKNTSEEPKKIYQKPVIQVDPGTIRIVKSFKGTETDEEELELLKSCSFKLEEQIPGSTNFRKVNGITKFTMTKSETETDYGPLVTEEYRGTKVTGVGKNLTPIVPAEGVHNNRKQYVLTISGLIPGRKYRVSELMASAGENATIGGRILRFKNIELTATSIPKNEDRNYAIGTFTLADNETKELTVKNVYEEDDKQILRIEKKVSGDLADKNQVFSFRLKVFKPDGTGEGVAINQTEFNTLNAGFSADTQARIQFNLNAGDSFIAFSLKHDQAIEFVLPKNYKYQVGENPLSYAPDVSADYYLHNLDAVGYRYTYKKDIEKKLDGTKEVLVFTNHRDPIPPMGVVGLGEIWRRNLLLLSLFIGAIIIMKKRKLILHAKDYDK